MFIFLFLLPVAPCDTEYTKYLELISIPLQANTLAMYFSKRERGKAATLACYNRQLLPQQFHIALQSPGLLCERNVCCGQIICKYGSNEIIDISLPLGSNSAVYLFITEKKVVN